MSNHTLDDREPTEEELARLRAALEAHAGEIALVATTIEGDEVVLALVRRDGRWEGTTVALDQERLPPYVAGDALAFWVPARCRTADAVRYLVREHLGGAPTR